MSTVSYPPRRISGYDAGGAVANPIPRTPGGLVIRQGKRLASAAAACALLLSGLGTAASACTTFTLETPNGVIFGKNYDFVIGDGMLVTNKRSVAKTAALDAPGGTPAAWVSRY